MQRMFPAATISNAHLFDYCPGPPRGQVKRGAEMRLVGVARS